MSETTSRFNLPYIMPGQAQKHVTHNEAVRAIDALLHVSVMSRGLNTPPTHPNEGESHLVGEMPSGEFTGHAFHLACFVDGAWMFYPPKPGIIANIEDEAICVIYRGSEWIDLNGDGAEMFDRVGINAAADNVNRLALNSEASLFNHNGGGHQLKINKNAESETAALLFQNGFSSCAEMGLVKDDDFSVKVSEDGSHFKFAMKVSRESGQVSFPNTPHLTQPVLFNMFGDGGRFGGVPEPLDVRLNGGFTAPNYIRSYNGSVLSQGDKYIDNSNDLGGNRGQMPAHLISLAQRIKPSATVQALRYGMEFYTLNVTAGTGTGVGLTIDEVTTYLAIVGLRFPMPARYTLSFWVRVTSGICALGNSAHLYTTVDDAEISDDMILPSDGNWHHVHRVADYDPNAFVGYESNLYRIYAAPNSVFEMAAPVLFPGTLASRPESPTGHVNALTAFM